MSRDSLRLTLVEWPPLLASVPAVETDVAVSSDEQIVPENRGLESDYSGSLMPWMDYEAWLASGEDQF